MPATRSHLTRPKPRQVPTINLGEGDTLNIVFDSNKITPSWADAARKRDEESDPLSLPQALAEVILSWDVTEDDGSPMEPNVENLSIFSYPVQSELMQQILKAAVPASEEGNGSSNISSSPSTASSETRESPQNGLQPSPSEKPLESPQPR